MNKYLITYGRPILFSADFKFNGLNHESDGIESAGFFLILNDKDEEKLKIVCVDEKASKAVSERLDLDEKIIADFLGIH